MKEKQVKKILEELQMAEEDKKQKQEASTGMDDESNTLKEQIADAKRKCCRCADWSGSRLGLGVAADDPHLIPTPPLLSTTTTSTPTHTTETMKRLKQQIKTVKERVHDKEEEITAKSEVIKAALRRKASAVGP